ncbi:MAG: Gfo/Idh/MocA family oxidoreductase [Proteobacteria bacterium]|nr:Gfo/Idh/MocA family oxidoreductase [Pseudomonadota bacterium]
MAPERRDDPSDPSRREFLQLSGLSAVGLSAAALSWVGVACSSDFGDKIRLGVVGGNFGASFFWHEHPHCEVAAATDLRADRRQRLREKYGCDNLYDSYEALIDAQPALDAVAIFSPPADHVKHTRWAFEQGWDVISAVPACTSLEEAAELAQLVESSGRKYMMAETSHYRAGCILARNLYREGAFGEIFYTEAEYYHDRGDLDRVLTDKTTRWWEPDGSRSWRWGYPPLAYPTHALSYLVSVTGERVERVSALGWGGDHPFLTESLYQNPFWNESALMATSGGHMLRCNVFWLVAGEGERAQWSGEHAALYMPKHGLHEAVSHVRTQQPGPRQLPRYHESDMLPAPLRHPSHHGHSAVFLTAEFINALVQNRAPEIGVYDALAMTVPGLVAHESALRGGVQLEVPQFDPTHG